ncbi:MAG: Ig-like domain-containing protein, partial [Bacteroidota bacterium]|nr:Ig-like domain-containing protein [Bacteroidota bacterium]
MRKSFTRLFSIFVLLLGLSFQMVYGIVFVPASSVPTGGNSNAKPADFATKFVVAFDVVPVISDAGGTAVIYKNGGLFKTFPVTKTSSSVVVVGKTLELAHGIASFTQADIYSVAITDGAITGLAAGALANGVYNFTIGDYVAPVLSSTAAAYAPLKGAVSVMANLDGSAFTLTVPFSEAVNIPATPGNLAVYIYKEDGTVVDIVKVSNPAITGLGTIAVTVPVAANAIFQENTKYYVSIDAGAFVDASPNKNVFGGLATPTTWTFTTRDYSAPAITATVTDITTSTAKLNVTLTEKGKYYYLLQTEVTADPANAAAVKAAGVAVTVTSPLTVTSNLALAGSTAYEVFVVSENAETPANLSSAFVKKTFSSIDATAPLSVARGLINNSAKKTSGVYMVFNEQVKGGTGTLDLRLSSNESYVKQIGANEITSRKITAAEVTANTFGIGRTVNEWVSVVDFAMTLPSNVAYYIVFPSGYIKDLSDNTFVGGAFVNPINKGDWGLTSSDFELPTVAVTFATPLSLISDINVTFNETVQKQLTTVTDWAQVLALEVNNVAVPFTVTSPAFAGNGTVIVIDPSVTLTSNTTYTVRLRPDAVMDMNNNAIVTENLYTVTTGDLDAFTVQYGSSVGATTTTGLVANSTFKIDFNKAVKVNTTGTTWLDATSENLFPFITFKKAGTAKAFTVDYNATTFTVTITSTDALVSNASDYTVELNGAKVRDSQSTLLSAAAGYVASQTYTVKDYKAPLAATSHSGNMPNDGTLLTITLTDDNLATLTNLAGGAISSDQITFKAGTSNGENLAFGFAYNAGTGVITITPSVALATGKTYYYGIGASVKDAAGNVTVGKFATFTMVAPAVAPTIVANTYTVNGSSQTPVAEKLVNIVAKTGNIVTVTVTFNDNVKEVQSVAPFNTISLSDGVSPAWTANVTPTNVSGNTLTVDFTGVTLASDVVCTLTLPAGIVQGSTAYTNTPVPTFAQFAGKNILFNSKDIVVPVVVANTPAASAVGVALNTALKLDFSEKVELGTGNIVIKKGATVEQTIAVNSSNVTLNAAGTQATVVKADLMDYNIVYTVEVAAGAFKDDISANGNALTSFTFTTVVNPQPVASTLSPADNSDQVALSPLTLGITFSEEVIKYDPLVGSRKLWYLVKEGNLGIRASFNATDDLVYNAGNDVVVANNYIETATVGISGKIVSISTGFTPVAGDRYYVLITQGAFLDKSTGVSAGGNPVPGVFAGVTSATTWNFTTKDENPGTVSFVYTKRADNKVAITSNITINFTRPIKKADGSVINDIDIANLFILNKNAGPGTLGVKAFVGTISADKKTVTILNSSLVTLGELTELSNYTIGLAGASIIYQNGSAVAGASDTFNTSDYTAPAVVASITALVADVKKDEATVQFTATDNMNLASLYYTIQAGDNTTPAPTAAVVKTGMMKAIVGASPQTASYKFTGLAEETSYVVWTVAVDEAGNDSPVSKIVFITDDTTKPLLVTKPANFDAAGKLTFVFNEEVSPAAASVRILDATSMTELAVLGLNAVPTKPTQLITDAFVPAITNALVNYYVEIDKGLVGDVPVYAGDAINYFDGLFRTDLMVTSKDVTLPNLLSSSIPAIDVPVNFSFTLTFDEKVKKATTLPVDALLIEKWNTTTLAWEPFEIVDPGNMVSNDTEVVTVTLARTLSSLGNYKATLKSLTFSDLSGNLHTIVASWVATFTAKDIVAPIATFTPAKNATGIAAGVTPLTMTFNEAIRLLDNTAIDSYDLDSLVYFKKDNSAIGFKAAIAGSVITITPSAALVADATYTYGFKAKFEDFADNAVTADAATFKTVVTTPAAQYLTWLPAKASPYVAPWPWLGTANTVTMNFTSPIFTHSTVAANNNLVVTPANIVSLGIITVKQNGVTLVANTDYVLSTPDNKTIVVTPKTNWVSSSIVEVIVNGATLQINEGNVLVLGTAGVPFDASTYKAEDIIDPIVDVTYAALGFTTGYYPAKVGLAGVSPVIAKTESLKLYFNEDVKVGTGTVMIYRWDGVLAKPAMVATVAADKRTVTLGDLTGLPTNQEYYAIVNPGVVVDVTDSNPYAGITDVKVWKFILKDDAIPQVLAYLPNTDNQPVNSKLTITFDRPVALTGAGYVALYKSAAGGDAIQIWRGADNGTTAAFTVTGNTVTVNLLPLDVNTKYFVELSANTFGSTA